MNYLYETEMLPTDAAVERLAAIVAEAGLSADDLIDLLQGGMELEHVMSYVSAVLTRKLN
jgi:hypothetical protein